jgi:excisionase family DNA binding protein
VKAMDEKLLRAEELAEKIGLKLATVRRWSYEKRIPAVRVGKRSIRYRLSDVQRMLLRDEPARVGSGER